jgi:hypothetical protein
MSGQTTLGVLVLAVAHVRFGCIPRKEADVPMSRGEGHLSNENALHERSAIGPPTVTIIQSDNHPNETTAG